MKAFISFLACLSLSLIAATAEATITTFNAFFYAEKAVEGGFGGGDEVADLNSRTIPTSTTVNVGNLNYHSDNSINWFVNSGQTVLSFDMDHKRPGGVSQFARTRFGLVFAVNSNEPYELSGFYNATDVASSGSVWLSVELKADSPTNSTTMTLDKQVSSNTINEQFVVGCAGGDSINESLGSLTGTLFPGYIYGFNYTIYTEATPDADSGASAFGNITLKIGTVPEPSTLLLLAIGAISLLGYRKLKSQHDT
jgi:PEP-CTERM motif